MSRASGRPRGADAARRALATIVVLAALAGSRTASARTVNYAIAIGNNTAPSAALPTLRYADDDAVRYYQLFSRFTVATHLLAVLDAQTQRRYPGVGAIAEPPTLANLARVVADYATRMAADTQRGDRPVLYLAFSGHGSSDASNGAFLALLDGPLTRERLYGEVIGPLAAAAVHLIVDACNAGAVVGVRGPFELDAQEAEVTLPEQLAVAEGAQRTWPTVGVVIATTAGQEAHEWSQIESGVFTHEVISGLLGAADVNRDGRIEYSELAAFIAAANRDIPDPRAAPRVIARPPPIDRSAPLIVVDALRASVFLTGDASVIGHFYVELDHGLRYLDAHFAPGVATRIAMPANAHVFIRTETREAAITTGASGSVAFDDLGFRATSSQARGSIDVAYRTGLFRHAYGDAYYRGFIDSAGIASVAFAGDVAPREVMARPDRRLAIGLAIGGGVAGITAIVSGAFAYSARRDYEATEVQRTAHDAAARYTRDLRISIASGVVAVAAAAASYWLWPRGAAAPVTATIATSNHTCAITRDGKLWCWGANAVGELGTGVASDTPTTAPSAPLAGSWLHVAVASARGSSMTCGIQTNHTLWCWGNDNFNFPPTSVLVPTQVGTEASWESLSMAGGRSSLTTTCAVKLNGTLWCWGERLGDGADTISATPVQVGTANAWKTVTVGGEICGIQTDGTLWCWNNRGLLGDGQILSWEQSATQTAIPTKLGSDTDWSTVMTDTAGSAMSCATKTDGSLWCWGTGAAPIPAFVTTPVPIR